MQNKSRAFTLIELLVVVLIIGILAAVAVSQYELAVEKSRAAEALAVLKNIKNEQEVFFLANNRYATTTAELGITLPQSQYWTYQVNAGNGTAAVAGRKGKPYMLFFRFSHPSEVGSAADSLVCGYDGSVYAADSSEAKYAVKVCKALGATGSGNRMLIKF